MRKGSEMCSLLHASGYGDLTVSGSGPHPPSMGNVLDVSRRRGPLVKLGVLLVVLAIGGCFILRGLDLKGLIEQTLGWIRTIGPVPFFLAMALLPAFGFPLLAFSLTAGPIFGPQLGLPLVSLLVVLSIVVNLALTYWLARYAFRPLLDRIVKRLGYQLPQVAAEDLLSLTVLVRVTPGPPFFIQSYLLGLAGVPFGTYMAVSSLIAGTYAVAVVFFGDSLANGRGKLALLAFSGLVALTVLIQWIRRRYQRKKNAVSSP